MIDIPSGGKLCRYVVRTPFVQLTRNFGIRLFAVRELIDYHDFALLQNVSPPTINEVHTPWNKSIEGNFWQD